MADAAEFSKRMLPQYKYKHRERNNEISEVKSF